jgi:hypothetical protein
MNQVDYSAKFSTEKHTFSGTPSLKSVSTAFFIFDSPQVDFVPLEIFTEFPNLNGLGIMHCKLPTLKAHLFKPEFERVEYLNLRANGIELIEPNAFQYLIKLKWISFYNNNLHTLSNRLFENNPDLIYIDLQYNKINSIHPSFFDGLQKLKLVQFEENHCIKHDIGCETCLIDQAELKEKLRKCHKSSENQLSGFGKALRNSLETLTQNIETGYDFGKMLAKETVGEIGKIVQPGV